MRRRCSNQYISNEIYFFHVFNLSYCHHVCVCRLRLLTIFIAPQRFQEKTLRSLFFLHNAALRAVPVKVFQLKKKLQQKILLSYEKKNPFCFQKTTFPIKCSEKNVLCYFVCLLVVLVTKIHVFYYNGLVYGCVIQPFKAITSIYKYSGIFHTYKVKVKRVSKKVRLKKNQQ